MGPSIESLNTNKWIDSSSSSSSSSSSKQLLLRETTLTECVCVDYCRTYYKAVRVGGGG
jgi:hypothetical protein